MCYLWCPDIRCVQPSLPAKPLDGPHVSCTHSVEGPEGLPLKVLHSLPASHGHPDGNQCQHDPIGVVGPGGTDGSEGGGGGGGATGGDSTGAAGGVAGGAFGGVAGGVVGGTAGGSAGGSGGSTK